MRQTASELEFVIAIVPQDFVRGYGESVSYHTVGKFLILNQWV
jgi:hypothetical protein